MLTALSGQWLSIDLMGHQRLIGQVTGVDGALVVLSSPAVAGDENHDDLPAATHVVNLAGPALHHATVVTEAWALASLASYREWKPSPRAALTCDDDDTGNEDRPF